MTTKRSFTIELTEDEVRARRRKYVREYNRKWRAEPPGYEKEASRRWRKANPLKAKMRAANWRKKNPEKALAMRKANDAKNRTKLREYNATYRKKCPHQVKAGIALYTATRNGSLVRPAKCQLDNENCRGKIQAHHCDYNKPLEVMWLCTKHHNAWHRVFIPEIPVKEFTAAYLKEQIR